MSPFELQILPSPTSTLPDLHPFGRDLSHEIKRNVASIIWGTDVADNINGEMLQHFFQYYADQTLAAKMGQPRRLPNPSTSLLQINTHGKLVRIMEILKENYSLARRDLRSIISTNGLANYDINTALDLAVRVMFMISCRSSVHSITTGYIFRPAWKDTESLAALVERVLPRHEIEPLERTESIRAHKLRARYFGEYTRIRIKWTNNLPDHLYLQVAEDWKTVQVFGQADFLAMGLRALAEEDEHLSIEESLSRGCLTPRILSETLRTIWLLFPEDDAQSFKYLQQEVSKNNLDPDLLNPLQIFHHLHERPQSLSPPEDMQDLFEQFPHWGERLYKILREVENPTPMTWYERWSDRRTSPRYTYWVGILALAFAVFFGLAATVLGALQVMMTYCAWLEDAETSACLAVKRKGKSG